MIFVSNYCVLDTCYVLHICSLFCTYGPPSNKATVERSNFKMFTYRLNLIKFHS